MRRIMQIPYYPSFPCHPWLYLKRRDAENQEIIFRRLLIDS